MFGLTKTQSTICEELIMEFNRLVTTPEQRETLDYLELSLNIYVEERNELRDAETPLELLDAICDMYVTYIQLDKCISTNLSNDIKNYEEDYAFEAWKRVGNNSLELDIFGATVEVCRSNMTKVPLVSEVTDMYGKYWQDAACDWIEDKYPGFQITTSLVDTVQGKRVLFKDQNGKVRKWFGFEEPQLDQFITLQKR